MLSNISSKGRKMVTIVDPHLKWDDSYTVFQEAKSSGFLVKDKDESDYSGWCWPGRSVCTCVTFLLMSVCICFLCQP